jgi:predicted amidophosphoribosyltransferase
MSAELRTRYDELALERFDCIVPSPADPRRRGERGFHHADLLCACLPHERLRANQLRRAGPRAPQARLGRDARLKNLDGAFVSEPWSGETVLLVDDVATTGATLVEAARTLLAAGASSVGALVYAYEE